MVEIHSVFQFCSEKLPFYRMSHWPTGLARFLLMYLRSGKYTILKKQSLRLLTDLIWLKIGFM